MKRRVWIAGRLALVAIAAGTFFLFVRPSNGTEHPATVIETVNQVDAHPRPRDDWRPAAVEMLIYGGGRVRTGPASSARLELLEGMVKLAADSLFTVKKSSTRQDNLITTLFLEEGRLWANLTSDQTHEFTVETGNAAAVVRDTRFSVKATAGETLVSVAQGEVVLTAQEQSVTVSAEQQALVEAGQPPSPPQPLDAQERVLWATEGEMPELAPQVEMGVDVSCGLEGPAGDPAARDPTTAFDATVQHPDAARVTVQDPSGETIPLPAYGDVYGALQRFHRRIPGLPRAGGTYTFTALDAAGVPIPGAVASDVYVGGLEPDPPANVQAQVTADGLLVTWDPSPVIPGAFDPGRSPPAGFYQISLDGEGVGTAYGWNHQGPLPETSHLIPNRRQDFRPGDRGQALEELEDSVYHLVVIAFSTPPPGTDGQANECAAHDPTGVIQVVIQNGQARVEGR